MKNYIKRIKVLLGLLLFCISLQGMENNQNIKPAFVEWLSRWHEEKNINLNDNVWVTYGQYHSQVDNHVCDADIDSFYGNFIDPEIRYFYSYKHKLHAELNYKDLAIVAKEYNNKHTMMCWPQKIHENIYMHLGGDSTDKKENLKQHIKTLLNLQKVCKHFNNTLSGEKIGQLCANYEKNVKDNVFAQLFNNVNDVNYWRKRFSLLILVHAGVHPDSYLQHNSFPLLLNSIQRNDLELSKIMLDHGADVNRKTYGGPIFFFCKTKAMAELLMKYDLNVHQKDSGENIVWNLLFQSIFVKDYLDLLTFYIEQGVDIKTLRNYDNACLLHIICGGTYCHKDLKAVKIAKILLPKMHDMVNVRDNKGMTPLDKIFEKKSEYPQLIALFKEYGAKTAQELRLEQIAQEREKRAQQEQEGQTKSPECFICCYTKENMMNIPCDNNHTEEICIDCYSNILNINDKCPLCRADLKKDNDSALKTDDV